MANQVSNLNIEDNLYSRALNDRNDFSRVYDLSGGYSKLLTIINILNAGNSKSIDTDKYEKSFMTNGYVISQIASSSTSGANVIVVLADPTYDNFRVNDLVMCESLEVQGIVVAKTPGLVTITPAPGGTTTAQLAAEFVLNKFMKAYGDAQPLRNSVGRESLYQFPDVDFNYTQVIRESTSVSRRDKIKSRVMWEGGMWWEAQQPLAIEMMLKRKEFMSLWGRRGKGTINGQEVNTNGGIDWAIKERPVGRGVYYPLASLPSESTFEKFLSDVYDRKAQQGEKFLMMGRGMLHHIQKNFTKDFIQYAGTLNTFGGSDVTGLNVMQYSVAGMKYNFMEMPILNDPDFFPEAAGVPGANFRKRQYDCYCLDLDPIPVKGGGTAPAIEKIHFGGSEYYEAFIAGMDSAPSGGVSDSAIQAAAATRVVTDVDNSTYHVMSDCGYDMIGKFSGKMELI
jgi:hypothetical protein